MATSNIENMANWTTLIVDDEPDNLKVAEKVLSFNGATVVTAVNGLEGLAALKEQDYTFILLDLSMPQMDGWEMFKALRKDEDFAHLPVIALTAHAMEGDREKALKLGFDGYITKPFRIDTLIKDIKAILVQSTTNRKEKDDGQRPTHSSG